MVTALSGTEAIDAIREQQARERLASVLESAARQKEIDQRQKEIDQHIADLRADLQAMVPEYLQRLGAAGWPGGHIRVIIVGETTRRTWLLFGRRRTVPIVDVRAIWTGYFCGITSLGELVEFRVDSDPTWLMGRIVKLDELSLRTMESLVEMIEG